jgi:adenylate cyclase
MDPVSTFTLAGATTGLATMSLDGDTIARHMAEADDCLWRMAIRTLIRSRPGSVTEPNVPPDSMLRYIGPAHTFPYVSYYQVINNDPSIPPDFFTDQIVLVGRDVRASPELGATQADTFATPFLMTSGLLTPGVEIHANQIENALMGQFIQPVTLEQNILAVSAVLLLALPLLVFWHPLRSTLLAMMIAGSVVGVSFWLFQTYSLLLATATPLASLFIAFLSTGAGSFFTERRRAGEIRSAFAKYVSSDVVEEMIAHPERLKLGGHRREVSVLFSDLAGFTSMSEKLSADAVANVINIYLNAMTRIIMANQGTVDKFIGDAVMAFWGAPLDDKEHALHAVKSAIAMQEAMIELQPQFRALGVEQLKLRIGINSGPAIVGNMGSDLRFDYTAIGDTVNLAARLEGANKAYGTNIMLANTTAEIVAKDIPIRQIDRVRVKGKNVPVDVFIPCNNTALIVATESAWKAYIAQDWVAARRRWLEISQIAPQDSLIKVFDEKINALENSPPPAEWDGSIALEKL